MFCDTTARPSPFAGTTLEMTWAGFMSDHTSLFIPVKSRTERPDSEVSVGWYPFPVLVRNKLYWNL